jgi:hypothetical protein
MAESTTPASKPASKKLPTAAVVAIGCFVVLAIIGFGITMAGKLIFSKIGTGLIQKGIESKTGMKIDSDGNKFSFTDPKTGESVNFAADKMPENFPKDFPIYPGAKFTGSMSGGNNAKDAQGFWVILSTPDTLSKVTEYYKTNLDKSGYTIKNTMNLNEMTTWTVKKDSLGGGVTVTRGENDKETTITVTLGTETTQTSGDSETPTE